MKSNIKLSSRKKKSVNGVFKDPGGNRDNGIESKPGFETDSSP